MAILNNSNAISTAGGYDINNSLRLRRSALGSLSRTPSSTGNRKTWTWSAWIKRGLLDATQRIFTAGTTGGSNTESGIQFYSAANVNAIDIYSYNTSYLWQLSTTQLFRDPSAWYHLVVAFDTTQATASNRIKMYVNGTQVTAFSTATYPAQNADTIFNLSGTVNNIGTLNGDTANNFDGYLADVNFIDGSQKAASDFGETDTTTGSWKPKAYTGTYGTNGFYLKFSDIATTSGSNAGLGKDFSGNTNYWTTNNISVTAGTTYDAMIDSPTLTSATVANYAVLNPLSMNGGTATLSNANLTFTNSNASHSRKASTIGVTSGKWYAEVTLTTLGGSFPVAGIVSTTVDNGNTYIGADTSSYGYASSGQTYSNAAAANYGASFTTGDIIGIIYDADNGKLYFSKNGTIQNSGDPSAGTGFAYSGISGQFLLGCSGLSGTVWNINYGQRPFSYTPPTGFVRLNTYNLLDSTIKKGNTAMDAVTYTGDGTTRTVSNLGFTPDFVWTKSRSNATSHILCDRVRGNYLGLSSDTTGAEGYNNYTQFNSAGSNSYNQLDVNNANAYTYVNWIWKAGNTSGSSNTSGTITSTVSVNATAGFSIVTYTGTGSAATIGHGLGVAPKMIIVKGRNTAIEWLVYHASLGATQYITLNTTGAAASAASAWNNTSPTSSVFSVLSAGSTNFSGTNYVAYCFAQIEGFSSFGSYTGNGSTDGTFVYTGFRPKFIMVKASGQTGNWFVMDSMRDSSNVATRRLLPNLSNAEDTSGLVDFTANGFKLRMSSALNDASTYIYMAFAESPFKNSLAR
jgi:hypothetical protein